MDQSLSTYFKWILSFIFVSAGILKMFSPDNTGDILIFIFELDYSTSLIIVYVIAAVEIILGSLLFIGIKKNIIKLLVLFSCGLFLLIAIIGLLDNWNVACGCFGRFSFGRFDKAMVLRNSLLVFMSFWTIYGDTILKNLTSNEVKNQQSKIGVNHED